MYEYAAQVVRVVDGDTLHVQVDPGLDLRINLTIRLYGVNAPEMRTDAGKAAKAWVADWLAAHAPTGGVVLITVKDKREKYGRYLGSVFGQDLHNLNADIVAAGHAVPYMVK